MSTWHKPTVKNALKAPLSTPSSPRILGFDVWSEPRLLRPVGVHFLVVARIEGNDREP